MKFLVDACAGTALATWLVAEGHDVIDASGFERDPGDDALLAHARRERRVVITLDHDFATLIFRDHASHAGIIRLPDVRVTRRIQIVQQVLDRHANELAAAAIVTVQGDRIRIAKGC